jgi:hypothetical protein
LFNRFRTSICVILQGSVYICLMTSDHPE